jgi:hypothetical protein
VADFLETVYADDEAIHRQFPGDFAPLIPPAQVIASGTDGAFANGSPWTLNSSVDFAARGVKAGMLVTLRMAQAASRPAHWVPSGMAYAVDAAPSGGSLALRVVGQPSGAGQPPAPTAGLSGVLFEIRTFYPQIEDASFDLNREFSIDPDDPARSPANLTDLRDLRRACVLLVVKRALIASIQNKDDRWATLEPRVCEMFEHEMQRLRVRWIDDQDGRPFFGMRVVR